MNGAVIADVQQDKSGSTVPRGLLLLSTKPKCLPGGLLLELWVNESN